jgi:dTDP-4-amino-4,6-dideoxygalactose transaminase
MINLNKIYYSGRELDYISQAMSSGKVSGNGSFTQKCQKFFEDRFHFKKVLLTPSCTAALELAALLLDIKAGDEVIVPSFTFVSTPNAFALRGAKIVFADSGSDHPNIDVDAIESLITPRTKVIVPVHYAGIACDMDKIMALAKKYDLFVVEDAAHAIDSYYNNRPLGSIGHLAAFSFHETKNITSGEGGMLVINDPRFRERAEILREMGTNRAAFFRGEVDSYGWVDVGSSFLLSEVSAAFLYAQTEALDYIQTKRIAAWNQYYEGLKSLHGNGDIILPVIPGFAHNNAHLFYFQTKSLKERNELQKYLSKNKVSSAFHYLSLHKSPFFQGKYNGRGLVQSEVFTNTLLRLPLYADIHEEDLAGIIDLISSFYRQ